MSESSISIARFGFFVCFIGLIAVGYYAYTLRIDLASAKEATSVQASQATSWKMKFDESEKASKANADATLSCQGNIKQLEEQLATAQASNAASKAASKIGPKSRKR